MAVSTSIKLERRGHRSDLVGVQKKGLIVRERSRCSIPVPEGSHAPPDSFSCHQCLTKCMRLFPTQQTHQISPFETSLRTSEFQQISPHLSQVLVSIFLCVWLIDQLLNFVSVCSLFQVCSVGCCHRMCIHFAGASVCRNPCCPWEEIWARSRHSSPHFH